MSCNNNNEEGTLSKEEKGRLKKLTGRATLTKGSNSPGITSYEDAYELRSLWRKANDKSGNDAEFTPFGPSIDHVNHSDSVNFSDPDCWKSTEGMDHGCLLQSILFGNRKESAVVDKNANMKKRKTFEAKAEQNPPSWSRLHNIGLTQNIAVIDFAISLPPDEALGVMPSYRMKHEHSEEMILSKLLRKEGLGGKKAMPLHCTMFQGDSPANISDHFMYLRKQSHKRMKPILPNERRKSYASSDKELRHHIFSKLNQLTLSIQTIQQEGYPVVINDKEANHQSNEDLSKLCSQLVFAAKEFVGRSMHEKNSCLLFDKVTSDHIVKSQSAEVALKTSKNEVSYASYVTTCLVREEISGCSDSSKVFAIDCEMVVTTEGFELARVTLLEYSPTINDPERYFLVLDAYVKPRNRIIDYLTMYSGIKPYMLENITTSLEEIQATLLAIICKDDILIGQALENDLKALRLAHFNVIDTAILFQSSEGKKYSLKHLSAVLLQQRIQHDFKNGHCSVEDAAACLRLAARRARLGVGFRMQEKVNHISLFSIIHGLKKESMANRPEFFQYHHGPIVCIGPHEWLMEHVASHSIVSALLCESISSSTVKAISSYLRPSGRRASVLWSRLCIGEKEQTALEANKKIDEIINDITCQSPPSTIILLMFQRGFDSAKQSHNQKRLRTSERSAFVWSDDDEVKLSEKIEIARSCEALWISFSPNNENAV